MRIDRNLSDLIKLVSCVNISVGHYVGFLVAAGATYNLPMRICTNCSALCVELFFLLSGYGLMESAKKKHLNFKDFIFRRMSKVYVPAVISAVIWGGYLLFNDKLRDDSICFILSNVLWGWFDGVLWFIQILLILYLLFFIYKEIDRRIKRGAPSLIALILVGCIGVTFAIRYYQDYMAIAVPSFFIGIAASRFSNSLSRVLRYHWTLFVLLIPTIILIWLFKSNNLILRNICNYFLILVLLTLCCHNLKLKYKLPTILVTISYDVYLVHYKVLLLLSAFYVFIPFEYFLLCTIVATFLFYLFRNMLVELFDKIYSKQIDHYENFTNYT